MLKFLFILSFLLYTFFSISGAKANENIKHKIITAPLNTSFYLTWTFFSSWTYVESARCWANTTNTTYWISSNIYNWNSYYGGFSTTASRVETIFKNYWLITEPVNLTISSNVYTGSLSYTCDFSVIENYKANNENDLLKEKRLNILYYGFYFLILIFYIFTFYFYKKIFIWKN